MSDEKKSPPTSAVAAIDKRQGAVETVILEGQKLMVKTMDDRGSIRTFKTNVKLTPSFGIVEMSKKWSLFKNAHQRYDMAKIGENIEKLTKRDTYRSILL